MIWEFFCKGSDATLTFLSRSANVFSKKTQNSNFQLAGTLPMILRHSNIIKFCASNKQQTRKTDLNINLYFMGHLYFIGHLPVQYYNYKLKIIMV